MTNIQEKIENILKKTINCKLIWVENESHNHRGNNPQSHFKVVIVSEDFANLSMIKRHQKLNSHLAEIYSQVHALSLRTYNPDEWAMLKDKPQSPLCASKKS